MHTNNCIKGFNASSFDKRVELQSISRVSDGGGGYTDSWATDKSIWCSISPANGYEKFQASQTETPITHKIKCRYDSDITTAKRLKYGSRLFNIKEALNVEERNAYMMLTVEEGTMT